MKMGAARAVQDQRFGRIVVEAAMNAEAVSLDGIEEYASTAPTAVEAEEGKGEVDGSGQ
jgi:hypothetical protein